MIVESSLLQDRANISCIFYDAPALIGFCVFCCFWSFLVVFVFRRAYARAVSLR